MEVGVFLLFVTLVFTILRCIFGVALGVSRGAITTFCNAFMQLKGLNNEKKATQTTESTATYLNQINECKIKFDIDKSKCICFLFLQVWKLRYIHRIAICFLLFHLFYVFHQILE